MTAVATIAPTTRTPKPKPVVTRDRYHRYTYAGVRYPGVTGILKVIDKSDALMAWAARNTAEAAIAQLANLQSLVDTVGPEGVVKALTARSGWKRDTAKDLGSSVHGYAELVVSGQEMPDLPDASRSRVEHYADWWQGSGWKLRLAEAFVVHTGLGYGGTLDLLAFDAEGRTVLADVKTGDSGVYGETRLQLAAYGDAELIAPQDSTLAYPMPNVDRYVVLWVTERGVEPIELDIDDLDRAAFAACIPLSQWVTDRKKRLSA